MRLFLYTWENATNVAFLSVLTDTPEHAAQLIDERLRRTGINFGVQPSELTEIAPNVATLATAKLDRSVLQSH